jgi:integrase
MPRKGKRKKLARCIYEDSAGRSGIYRDASGHQREIRFPPFTRLADIRDDLEKAKRKSRGSGAINPAARGTLNHAIDKWNGLEQHLASWRERRAELRAWAALYGERPLRAIRDADVRSAMGIWTQAGIAPKTIRNRLWTLRHLYRLILGPDADSPVDHVDPPAKVRRIINPTPTSKILEVYAKLLDFEKSGRLRDQKTRARFMVRAASGRRPVEIMRAEPEDVDLERRIWRVRDAKGGWSEGLYLNDDLLAAWKLFAESDAWGEFNTGSMAEVLRHAGWPEGVRPYNLRHSAGIALSELGVDLADVAGWLGQTDVRTTRGAYVPILGGRMERAGRLLEGRFNGWADPAAVPASKATGRHKLPQTKGETGASKKRRRVG